MEQSEKLKKLKEMLDEGILTAEQYNAIVDEEKQSCAQNSEVFKNSATDVLSKEQPERMRIKNGVKILCFIAVSVILITVFAVWDKSRIAVKAEEEYKTNLINYYNQCVACSNAIYKESSNISEKWEYLESYWNSKEEKKSSARMETTYGKAQKTFSALKECPEDFKDDYQSLLKTNDALTAYYKQVSAFSRMDKDTFNQLTGEKNTEYQVALENLSPIIDEYCELEDADSQK